jgi:uracil DNA glycosylase
MEIIDFFNVPSDWTDFFFSGEMEKMITELNDCEFNYPKKNEVFKSFFKLPFEKVSVVMIGNHPKEFSYSLTSISKTMQLIYKELENECYYPTKDGNIDDWIKQGVLFFTHPLTDGNYDTEQKIISLMIDKLSEKDDLIWVLFGKDNVIPSIPNIPENARVYHIDIDKMQGSQVFRKINKELIKFGKQPISW